MDWRKNKVGQRLCGNFSFGIMQVAADLEYLCNHLGLQHFNKPDRPCFLCGCNSKELPWSDLRPAAGWRSTLVGSREWHFTESTPCLPAAA